MSYTRCLKNKTSRLYELCLQIIYNDKLAHFEELLYIYSVSTYSNNIDALSIGLYKLLMMSPEIMSAQSKIYTLLKSTAYSLVFYRTNLQCL